VLPGYEMVMKASHTFNLLDARGQFGDRARAYIGRCVRCPRRPQAYYESREKLGFRWCAHHEHPTLLVNC